MSSELLLDGVQARAQQLCNLGADGGRWIKTASLVVQRLCRHHLPRAKLQYRLHVTPGYAAGICRAQPVNGRGVGTGQIGCFVQTKLKL